MKRQAIVLLIALSLLLALPAAQATTLQRMSIESMSRAAQAVARVRCLSNTAVMQHGEIWTLTAFAVEQTWRGSLGPQITVRSLGGNMGAVTSTVSGVPRFRPSEEAVLFLESSPYGDYFVLSWQQGTFRIHRDPRTSNETVAQDTSSYAVYDPRTRRTETSAATRMPIAALQARIKAEASLAGPR
jgi:hypothetical protein